MRRFRAVVLVLCLLQPAAAGAIDCDNAAKSCVAASSEPGRTLSLPTPAEILTYFGSIAGRHAVSGQFIELKGLRVIETIHRTTGQWLGMIGGDYWYDGGTGPPIAFYPFNAAAVSYARAGGLVTLIASMPNPTTGGSSHDTASLDAAGLLTRGTATNTALNAILNQVATGLAQLQAVGVTVLFRPYWESNGHWFWWGTSHLTSAQYVALWNYTHDYLTKTKKLTNLIWIWSPNAGFSGFPQTIPRFPGKATVDMTGFDLYSSNPADGVADYNALVDLGLPVCLAEYGAGGPAGGDPSFDQTVLIRTLQTRMPKVVFWQQWGGDNSGGKGWGMMQVQNAKQALTMPWVINRDELAISRSAGPMPSARLGRTILTPVSGGSVKDATGNTWTLSTDGVATRNGLKAPGGGGTSELRSVGGVIWAQDATTGAWSTWTYGHWTSQGHRRPEPGLPPL